MTAFDQKSDSGLPGFLWEKLTDDERRATAAVAPVFPLRITPGYARLIDWSNPSDPLRKQVIPAYDEMISRDQESVDPLDERRYMPFPGMIHKYQNRVLLLMTTCCPVHCRFCFRRCRSLLPEDATRNSFSLWMQDIERYLSENPGVHEVILSGGDPLIMDRSVLNDAVARFASIDSIRLIRIHTRAPVVCSLQDVNPDSIAIPAGATLRMVIHINHPNEISNDFRFCISRLIDRGIPVLSQTVLLAGVNDSVEVLTSLFLELVVLRVQPYYLHLLDRATGTGHFEVSALRGAGLIEGIREHLPGYAVPKLVRDVPGRSSKTPI